MKKNCIMLLGAALLTLGTVTSCGKSYTCHCEYATNGNVDHEDDTQINEGKKEKTAAACDDMDNVFTTELNGNTTTSTTECTLKD